MKKIFTLSKPSAFFIAFLCAISFGFGQVELSSYSRVNGTGCSGVIANNANVTAAGICRSAGIAYNTGITGYNSRNWTTVNALNTNDYLEWTLSPNANYQIDLTSLEIRYNRSNTGPNKLLIRMDTGSGFVTILNDSGSNTVSTAGEDHTIDLSTYTSLTSTITFRLYAFNAGTGNGTFRIEELTAHNLTDKGIIINGDVRAYCAPSTTWNGATWSAGVPNIGTNAIINGNYFTNVANPSFSACSLTVNAGSTLTVNNNYYVEVQNDITVDGAINVRPRGSVKQNSNTAKVTENGTISVTKTTAPLNAWYEYTYWSSPVSGETIGSGLSESDVDRRFRFNANNYLDALRETANNNTFVAGQDDVDDNGDDWTLVNGATVMQPGVGYAATHDEAGFVGPGSPPYQFDYTFTGPFNNGIINVNVVRNDTETNDNNWNLIGNPYPSAISADTFFSVNSYALNPTSGKLDGSIYLWSQNIAPSDSTNGNEGQNFSASDYATINGAAQTAGGDGLTPVRFIPSGQAFFVSVSDSPALPSGNVVFNNSMRVVASNTQFFRNSNTPSDNKLWVNLTSDNGVFNQIAIAYIDGATNEFDGTFYDAPRNLSANLPSSIYTSIEGNTKKFVIQGKNPNSLTLDEVIPLGFNTSINVPTVYTLSIAQFEGDFMTNNPIYLKDNVLNTIHNLSTSAYNFISQVGEFESRFEIVFQPETLSIGENDLNANSLTIIELNNDNVKFTVSNNFDIKSVAILDLLGRTLYQFEGQSNSEVYNLSNLSNTVYIAKVELSSGQVITKRAIKRN
ncbi:T9SS type A sorting domain-containing protein [Aquaticitalea lipolytica]|uniref:T9SS type A sorting domain-containing protein n=1 Tax=Aquaticitalea lipolytica TaxID=1247562 RepID=UPI0024B8E042|nr:T9SS type A sorting domain-containing protein [Aquaticitalea lipolytica]